MMFRQIHEADWKVLRELKPIALSRYCDRVLDEVVAHASDAEVGSHDRYLAIFKLIQERDATLAGAFNGLSRSSALPKLAAMRALGLVTDEEFSRLTLETREAVELLLGLDSQRGD
jgi:hypothetical protein